MECKNCHRDTDPAFTNCAHCGQFWEFPNNWPQSDESDCSVDFSHLKIEPDFLCPPKDGIKVEVPIEVINWMGDAIQNVATPMAVYNPDPEVTKADAESRRERWASAAQQVLQCIKSAEYQEPNDQDHGSPAHGGDSNN